VLSEASTFKCKNIDNFSAIALSYKKVYQKKTKYEIIDKNCDNVLKGYL
jgi:hypothetical protein